MRCFKYIINHSKKEYDLLEEKYYDRINRFEDQLKEKNIKYEIIESYANEGIEEEMAMKGYKDVHWSEWHII